MSMRMRCLWISRYVPYSLDEGAKVYSAKLSQALADSGAFVRLIGFGKTGARPNASANLEWLAVPGHKRNKALAMFSEWPIAAFIDATAAYRALLEAQLQEPWDVVVLDGYGTGWALDACLAYRDASRPQRPVLVHVSHNHEDSLWHGMAREASGSRLKRMALRRNADKVAALERRIVRNVDLLTTITEEDRRCFAAELPEVHSLALTPGYSGTIAGERQICAATPKRVLIMGSFQWVVKQDNLERFLKIADPIFQKQGIALDIIGDVPPALLTTLKTGCRATSFHGFVNDAAPFLARARIAIVPEPIGGGFKLKFLDYIFGRVPVATVSQAAAGLPEELQRSMLSSDSLTGLVGEIVSHIDRFDELNRMQERALDLAKAQFKWSVRGERFHQAIANVRQQMPGAPTLRGTPPGANAPSIDLAMS